MLRICTPIATRKISEIPFLIRRAENLGADLIEIRLDYLEDLKGIEKIPKLSSKPMIVTNRQYEQGGFKPQDEEERIKTLIDAAGAGFEYADIELTTRNLRDVTLRLRKMGVKPIVSYHNFENTPKPPDLEIIVREEAEAGAEICKLVTMARSIPDNVSCLLLTSKISKTFKIVCFAMGELGVVSRALSPIFGAYFTYASIEREHETAPGQITITELRDLYRRLGVKV